MVKDGKATRLDLTGDCVSVDLKDIFANLKDEKSKKEFEARFYGKNGKKQEINSKEQVDQILKDIERVS